MNEYIKENNEITGVKGEETKLIENFNFGGWDYTCLVTLEKDYYNFYIIDEHFKQEPLNNLRLQEEKKFFDKLTEEDKHRFMEELVIQHYLWFKYNRDYSIDSEEIPEAI